MRKDEKMSIRPNGQEAKMRSKIKKTYCIVGIGIFVLLLFLMCNLYLNKVTNDQLESTMYLNQYRLGSKTLTAAVQSYAVTGEKEHYNEYMTELNEDKNRDIAWEGLKKHNLKEDEWAELEHIAEMSNGLVPLEEEAMEKASKGDTEGAIVLVFGESYEGTVKEINDTTNQCISDIQERIAAKKSMVNIAMYITMIVFFFAFLMMVNTSIATMNFAKRELLKPILKVSEQLKELAQGRFQNHMDLEADDSEVGDMVGAIQFMNQNFTNMISELSQVLGEMGQGNYRVGLTQEYVGEFTQIKDSMLKIITETRDTLNTIQNSAKEIGSGSEQLAHAAADLAEGCTVQANKTTEASGMIDSMAQSLEEKAEEAKNIAAISTEAAQVVDNCNKKMQELRTAIEEINKRSEEIGSIIAVIEDIAEQTNLLSLNASIEAARAGEAGRGFAVVAEQVKNLADQSVKAAAETTTLIQTTIDAVEKGTILAEQAEGNMTDVMEGAKMSTNKMIQMAEELQREVESMRLIDESITNIAEIVDNNSAASQETAAVSEEESAQVQTMIEMIEKFEV